MLTWLINFWDYLKGSLWFIPAICLVVGIAAGMTGVIVEYNYDLQFWQKNKLLFTTASNAQSVLSVLVGALITIVGLVFSLTAVSLSQTASQYGPRLIRTVLEGSRMQMTLGSFLGTATFSLIILRSITQPDEGPAFVPQLSVLVAQVASVGCICLLIHFTAYIGRCLRAEYLIEQLAGQLPSRGADWYPLAAVHDSELKVLAADVREADYWPQFDHPPTVVTSEDSGYLQAIDLALLEETLRENALFAEIIVRPGEFATTQTPIAHLWRIEEESIDTDDVAGDLQRHFIYGPTRTARQDPECVLMELVEMAVRALSPGVNDPVTAINVIDRVCSELSDYVRFEPPGSLIRGVDGEVRLKIKSIKVDRLLATAYNLIRQNARDSVAVYCRLLEALQKIALACDRVDVKSAVGRQADLVLAAAQRKIDEPYDLADIELRWRRCHEQIGRDRSIAQ